MTLPLAMLDLQRAVWLAIGVSAGSIYTSLFFIDGYSPTFILAWFSLQAAVSVVAGGLWTWSLVRVYRARRAVPA